MDTAFTGVFPALKAVDNGDGTYSVAASIPGMPPLTGLTSGELLVATSATTAAWQNTGVKLTAPDIQGVVTAAAALTMPTFKMGGDIQFGDGTLTDLYLSGGQVRYPLSEERKIINLSTWDNDR